MTRHAKSVRRLARDAAALALLLAMASFSSACNLDEILEVDIPGKVDADALDNPALAQVLVNSVIGDVECAWNNYTAAATHHSDEWIPTSGNLNMRNWGQRKIEASDAIMATGDCAANYGIYTPLHTARFQSEDVFTRLAGFENVEDATDMQAQVRAWGGFALVGLGEGFCSMAIDGGSRMTPADVMGVAEAKFTDAIALAQSSGNTDIETMATVGRARARLYLENWAGVIADAASVPAGYEKVATRSGAEPRRYNAVLEFLDNPDDETSKHGSIADHFRDLTVSAAGELTQNDGTPDPRTPVQTRGELGFDFATIHYFTDKYTSRADPVPVATYREAQMYLAEAYARTNDLASAVAVIDARRAAAGLPAWSGGGSATQDEVIQAVINERSRELFVEGGHRLNDMLRLRGTAFEIPFLGEPGSIHPDGLDQTGAGYGTITCFPLPLIEENGNPNVT